MTDSNESEIKAEKNNGVCGENCEVYSRVVGYMRPISGWNKGKQAEYKKRRTFSLEVAVAGCEESNDVAKECTCTEVDEDINKAMDRKFNGTPGY